MAKKELTPEQKELLRANLEKARAARAQNRAASLAEADREAQAILDGEPRREPASEPAVSVAVPDAAAARRRRLLGDLDAETAALFTDAELEAIEREERDRARLEQKRKALADVRAVARQRAQIEHDLVSADTLRSEEERRRLAEEVEFVVHVPDGGAGEGQTGIRIDGFIFQEGRRYRRPRAVFESLQEVHYRAWLNEIRFRTLDQHKRGHSAEEIVARTAPRFEAVNG